MSMTAPVRRSARHRTQSKKYTVDVFAGLNLERSDDEDEQTRESLVRIDEDSEGSDADFDANQATSIGDGENEDEDGDEQDESGESTVGVSGDSSPSTPTEEESSVLQAPARSARAADDGTSTTKAGKKGEDTIAGTKTRNLDRAVDSRRRGLIGKPSKTSRNRLIHGIYGNQSLSSLRVSMDNFSQNLTFPSKRPRNGIHTLIYPPGYIDGLASDFDGIAKPYFPSGPEASKLEVKPMKALKAEDGWQYLQGPLNKISLLVGPHQSQKSQRLSFAETLDLCRPFGEVGATKRGWLVSTGGRVLSISWAPKLVEGVQYLAVSVDFREHGKAGNPFVPSEGYSASIQIWRFDFSDSNAGSPDKSSEAHEPRLVRVLCTNWGTCRRLKWSPCASSRKGADGAERIGLLATVWTDGFARALEITIASGQSNQVFWQCEEASFKCRPPDSVCSCIEWLTPTDLAIGCANGFVAIWDLSMERLDGHAHKGEGLPSDRPYFYHPFSETYILELICAGPEFPHLLASISASGVQMLTDLRSPSTDKVSFARSRVYPTCIRYSPHVHGFYAADDQGDIAFLVTKRFYSARRVLYTSATPAGGVMIATSPLHTSVLVGTPDGTVTCTNPILKQLGHRNASAYSQRWFVHEWRDSKDCGHDGDTATASDLEEDLGAGIARITEGFKAEKIDSTKRKAASHVQTTVIYNEEQAITALEWNPNIRYGTWAAAAMGSGLIRIEDVGV